MTVLAAGNGELLAPYQLLVDNEWRPARSGRSYPSINPYSRRPWASIPDGDEVDVGDAVQAATRALRGPWGAMTGFERARLMRRLAELIARDAHELAVIESTDNGKLLREMQGQLEYLPEWLYYFAGVADKLEGSVIPSDRKNFHVYTRHEPVGVVGAIVPWNSPLLLLMWKLAPALAAGCPVVVKPSDYTPVSALEFGRRVVEAGFPPGVFNVVTGQGPAVGQALVTHPLVSRVAFTGSTTVGREIARAAGNHLARVSLELGGKSAQLVFPDADLELAANGVMAGIFAATGQTCIAGSRLVVHEDVREPLLQLILERARTIRLGDPLDPATEMGPLANEVQLKTVLGFIERARQDGAEVVLGGRVDEGLSGLFVRPTIVVNVTAEMEIAQEEIFGPVLTVMSFTDMDEAIGLCNSTRYGLAAGVWTKDLSRAHLAAERLQAGTVWVNCYRVVAPNVPFGGVHLSGWGRENGLDAVRSFTETKAVWIQLDPTPRDPFKLG